MSEPKWPIHGASLHIMHNEHKSYYETVERALESGTYDREDFPDDAEIQKAIELNSVWKIQWYPRTPIGFCVRCAATFERVIKIARGEDE